MRDGEFDARLERTEADIAMLRDRSHDVANEVTALSGQQNAHERVCAERWESARSTMLRIETSMNGLYRRWWGAQIGIIAMLLGLVGFLAQRALFP